MEKKILIIDDDQGIIEAFQALLESAGYEVETAQDSEIIQNLSTNDLPNLIVLDVLLSGEDGRDICKNLKKRPLTKDIPVIMVSAHPGADESTRQVGADDFIAKPFELMDFLTLVRQHIH